MSTQTQERLEGIAGEYGFDLGYSRRNGDRLIIAVLEQVVATRMALEIHERREGQLIRGGAAILIGIGLCTWTAIWPAVEARLELMSGVDIPPLPAWPPAVMQSLGGLAILIGIAWMISPRAVRFIMRQRRR